MTFCCAKTYKHNLQSISHNVFHTCVAHVMWSFQLQLLQISHKLLVETEPNSFIQCTHSTHHLKLKAQYLHMFPYMFDNLSLVMFINFCLIKHLGFDFLSKEFLNKKHHHVLDSNMGVFQFIFFTDGF